MQDIDRDAYETYRELESKRLGLAHEVLKRALGDLCPDQKTVPNYDEWLAAGKPNEMRVRRVLAAFGGRDDLMEGVN